MCRGTNSPGRTITSRYHFTGGFFSLEICLPLKNIFTLNFENICEIQGYRRVKLQPGILDMESSFRPVSMIWSQGRGNKYYWYNLYRYPRIFVSKIRLINDFFFEVEVSTLPRRIRAFELSTRTSLRNTVLSRRTG